MFVVLVALAAQAQPVTLEIVEIGGRPGVKVTATGEPVAIPACRGVTWELFDDTSGSYTPITGPPCGPMANAVWVTSEGMVIPYVANREGFHVVRPVVVVGTGCRQGEPFVVSGCESMQSVTGGNASVR